MSFLTRALILVGFCLALVVGCDKSDKPVNTNAEPARGGPSGENKDKKKAPQAPPF